MRRVIGKIESQYSDMPHKNIYDDGSSKWIYPVCRANYNFKEDLLKPVIAVIIGGVIFWSFVIGSMCLHKGFKYLLRAVMEDLK